MKLWPYRILKRNDDDIKNDLSNIMQHFLERGLTFDTIIFVPNAGFYLSKLFREMFDDSFEENFVTVRRVSTVSKSNFAKEYVFKRKWLSNIMRHCEVLLRLVKYKLGISQKMVGKLEIDFNVTNKRILVIDDSVDTGTTLRMVKSVLLENGAQSVVTACISNHLVPDKVDVNYSLYRYRLLRTKNSRDYYAT
ncbi:phosphoribosyltransferase [bacterium]|nr:phosphoribosyltransferase [bacterium]